LRKEELKKKKRGKYKTYKNTSPPVVTTSVAIANLNKPYK
jgi:hypothetical protein